VEYYGLGRQYYDKYPSHINSVTRVDVLRVAQTYLHLDRYVLSIVADLNQVDLSGLKPEGP